MEDEYRNAIDKNFTKQQEWSDAYSTGNENLAQLNKQVDESAEQKKEAFQKLVEVEECILIYEFADQFPELIRHHLEVYQAGFESSFLKTGKYDPASRWDTEDILDYWDNKDPDA